MARRNWIAAAAVWRAVRPLGGAAAQSAVKAPMLIVGAEPAWANAPGLARFMQADTAQWKKVAAFAKISLD